MQIPPCYSPRGGPDGSGVRHIRDADEVRCSHHQPPIAVYIADWLPRRIRALTRAENSRILCPSQTILGRVRGRTIAFQPSLLGFQQSVDLRYQFHELFRVLFISCLLTELHPLFSVLVHLTLTLSGKEVLISHPALLRVFDARHWASGINGTSLGNTFEEVYCPGMLGCKRLPHRLVGGASILGSFAVCP